MYYKSVMQSSRRLRRKKQWTLGCKMLGRRGLRKPRRNIIWFWTEWKLPTVGKNSSYISGAFPAHISLGPLQFQRVLQEQS